MNKQEQKQRAEAEARRTMDLLDRQSRQEADPWLVDRTMARLNSKPEPAYGPAASFQWALTVLLLVLNSTALYIGLNSETQTAQSDFGQMLDEEYELSASASDVYDSNTNTYDDDFFQSN